MRPTEYETATVVGRDLAFPELEGRTVYVDPHNKHNATYVVVWRPYAVPRELIRF